MHFELLVEEPSMEATLLILLPRILHVDHTFRVHPHQGKADLLRRLPGRLRGYRRFLPEDWRIVVVVDRDREECVALKRRLNRYAATAKLTTRSRSRRGRPIEVLNRIAVEELEAWFFGDPAAIRSAYPRLPAGLLSSRTFRDPDAIKGGTWEALERVLQSVGYHRRGLPKIRAARAIAACMNPDVNVSRSFQVFRDGLRELAG